MYRRQDQRHLQQSHKHCNIWKLKEVIMYFKEFHVTGLKADRQRFKTLKFKTFNIANSINLYKGSVWGVTESGKRKLLKRVYN